MHKRMASLGGVCEVELQSCLWQSKLPAALRSGYEYFGVNILDEVSCRFPESRKFSFEANYCPQFTPSLYLGKEEIR